ncbi:unnamed protein product, partial [Prorocentrum cordatum]
AGAETAAPGHDRDPTGPGDPAFQSWAGFLDQPAVQAAAPSDTAAALPAQPVCLLSLFDSLGMTRVALDGLLRDFRHPGLAQSGFAEADATLAAAVERSWATQARLTGTTPHVKLAGDIWDLFRGADPPLARFGRGFPPGSLVLVIAGTPPQQLHAAGPHQGRQGLCGDDSYLFWTIPLVVWSLQGLRPDCHVHAVVESAATTHPLHRAAMTRALGDLDDGGHVLVVDSRAWAPFPRRRLYLSTLPIVLDPSFTPVRRPAPWEGGFAPHWDDGGTAPMTRSTGLGDQIRHSTPQYHPRTMLYAADAPWRQLTLNDVAARFRRILPRHLLPAFGLVLGGRSLENNLEAQRFACWVETHGAAHGVRMPSPAERAAATGHGPYLAGLGLEARQLFDAVGSHLDVTALQVRLRGPLRDWLQGRTGHPRAYHAPAALLSQYRRLAADVDGLPGPPRPTREWPVPLDLVGDMLGARRPAQRLAGPDAEHPQDGPASAPAAAPAVPAAAGLPARTRAWAAVRDRLAVALAAAGVSARVRSANALWLLLHRSRVPPGATWGRLCEGRGLSQLLAALREDRAGAGLRLAAWNIRWLVDPHATNNSAKRRMVQGWLDAGRIVLLGETHWGAAEQALWAAQFPPATVHSSPAQVGPGGGATGGVAVLLPATLQATTVTELVPGCALAVHTIIARSLVRFVSLYLPPGAQRATLAAVRAALPAAPEVATYLGGDVNFQLHEPRDGEEELAAEFHALLHAHGLTAVTGAA